MNKIQNTTRKKKSNSRTAKKTIAQGDKTHNLHEDIAHLLRRANQYSQVTGRKILGPYKITPIQYAVLYGLEELGTTIQRRLALHVGLEPSNLHAMLKRLATRNLISASIDSITEHRDSLTLTKKGRNLLNELNPLIIQHNKDLMALLLEEEKEPFVSAMKKIAAIR